MFPYVLAFFSASAAAVVLSVWQPVEPTVLISEGGRSIEAVSSAAQKAQPGGIPRWRAAIRIRERYNSWLLECRVTDELTAFPSHSSCHGATAPCNEAWKVCGRFCCAGISVSNICHRLPDNRIPIRTFPSRVRFPTRCFLVFNRCLAVTDEEWTETVVSSSTIILSSARSADQSLRCIGLEAPHVFRDVNINRYALLWSGEIPLESGPTPNAGKYARC